jgi:predicted phosphodiesterase
LNLLIIGDPHANHDYDNDRFTALGEYIVQEKPEYVVCLGDMADMPSLSSYDKGTKGFEGRRYSKDVEAVIDAQEKLFAPIKEVNRMLLKKKVKQYKPKLYMTLGNHEHRIDRATEHSAELDGTISINDLQYKKFGWKCTPFKECLTIKGISFSHYFTTGAMGRPISGINIGNSMMNKLHCSAVQGHSHLISHQESTKPDGQKIFGLSAGCYSHPAYSENWCRDTEYQWWRGVITLEGLDGEGYYDSIHAITQRALMR